MTNYTKIIREPFLTTFPVCCGIDVHKSIIVVCLILTDNDEKLFIYREKFGAFTKNIIELREWLIKNNCPVVAIESTSVYWRPVHNVLEKVIDVFLVNARQTKNVPGKKTDIKDSEWLAILMNKGLLNKSYIPEKEQREWRELYVLRKSFAQTLGNYKRRVHKLFETANIKISSVVTDLFGATGLNLIRLLESGKKITLKDVEKCARGSLKEKVDELYDSIEGFFTEHHRFQLELLMNSISNTMNTIDIIENKIDKATNDYIELFELLDPVPGINKIGFQGIISYIGTTMDPFPSDNHLVSWAGLCPGNNESAGKRKNTKSPVHKNHFKSLMIELAWAAIKKKGSYYRDKYYRLKARIGANKAIVAIANRMLRAIYHIIKDRVPYRELGENYLSEKQKQSKINYLKKQAQMFGLQLVPKN